jgi:hypothetical protein
MDIDVEATEDDMTAVDGQHFRLKSRAEVEQFEKMLHEHTRKATRGHAMDHISLPKIFDLCQRRVDDGGKIFTAFLDIQINLAMLARDNFDIVWMLGKNFPHDPIKPNSILDSQPVFDDKLEIHRHTTNFIFRYRALWDKVMGVLVLIIAPNEYEKYAAAPSRRKHFKTIIGAMPEHAGLSVAFKPILDRIDKFRTPEAHGSGRVRKYSLSTDHYVGTPLNEILIHWNTMCGVSKALGQVMDKIE